MERTDASPTEHTPPTPSPDTDADSSESKTGSRWWIPWTLLVLLLLSSGSFVWWEARTSKLQARIFSNWTTGADWTVEAGPSSAIRYPDSGPFDRRLGYVQLPEVVDRLTDGSWRVTRQARVTPEFLQLVDRDAFHPYLEKQNAGLELVDVYDNQLHYARHPTRVYPTFEAIPELMVDTLLFIENKALLAPSSPHHNPAVEPDRMFRVLGAAAWSELSDGKRSDGGSTLATQIEKFRHSPGGRTHGYEDKYQQMLSASIRAYLDGPDTTDEQRYIVRTYLNSVPLASVGGVGEVFGIGDGLHAWYGADFDRVNVLLADIGSREVPRCDTRLEQAGRAYRQMLSLMVAQRRPSWYLGDGRENLAELTDHYIGKLRASGVISRGLASAARQARPTLRTTAPADPDRQSFRSRKLPYSLRADLLELTGAESLYELDRRDLTAETTVDTDVQRGVEHTLGQLDDPAFLEEHDLDGWRMLEEGDPSEVVYSFTLYERTPEANLLRVQADTYEGPFNVNEGVKLNLGSTAKLRTTISYLQIVGDLWEAKSGLPPAQLDPAEFDHRDRISRWVVQYLKERPHATLEQTLEAALDRRYSANPNETFFTGGGVHRFSNFSYKYNDEWPTVRRGLQKSINLVFVRLIRDIVRYHMFRMPGSDPEILRDGDHPKRREYLERFADYEGKTFLHKFYDKHKDHSPRARLIRRLGKANWSPEQLGAIHRSVYPDADIYTFNHFLTKWLDRELPWEKVKEMHRDLSPDEMGLNDRGYVAGVHPLDLWIMRYLRENPDATWTDVKSDGKEARQKAYEWLHQTRHKSGQDRRIRILLERDAFSRLHEQWKQQGYAFDRLVPSYATALGSSADRPSALSKLVGLLINDGRRKPTVQFRTLHFARNTPFETELRRDPPPDEQVLRPEVARTARRALVSVVREGTAQRLTKFDDFAAGPEDDGWLAGGKTGTGDNRYKRHNSRGHLIESIPRNRTATFTFFIDNRFFGSLTAYVPGRQSGEFEFTSGLAVRILGILGPKLRPLWDRGQPETTPPTHERHVPGAPLADSARFELADEDVDSAR